MGRRDGNNNPLRQLPKSLALVLGFVIPPTHADEPPTLSIGSHAHATTPRYPVRRDHDPSLTKSSPTRNGILVTSLVCVVVGSAVALAWLQFRQRQGFRRTLEHAVTVLGVTPLGQRNALHVVRAGRRVLLIGTGAQGPPALLGELESSVNHTSINIYDVPRPDPKPPALSDGMGGGSS